GPGGVDLLLNHLLVPDWASGDGRQRSARTSSRSGDRLREVGEKGLEALLFLVRDVFPKRLVLQPIHGTAVAELGPHESRKSAVPRGTEARLRGGQRVGHPREHGPLSAGIDV